MRAALASSAATFMALVTHVAGGGEMPGWLGIAVPWVLSLMVCTVLAGRRVSLIRLTAAVAVSQVLFHVLFVLGTVPAGVSGAAGGHAHVAVSLPPLTASTAAMVHAGPMMWLWHGLAAAVTVVFLYRGERAAQRLSQISRELSAWLRHRIQRPVVGALFFRPARVRVDTSPRWRVASAPYLSILRLRGPPPVTVF